MPNSTALNGIHQLWMDVLCIGQSKKVKNDDPAFNPSSPRKATCLSATVQTTSHMHMAVRDDICESGLISLSSQMVFARCFFHIRSCLEVKHWNLMRIFMYNCGSICMYNRGSIFRVIHLTAAALDKSDSTSVLEEHLRNLKDHVEIKFMRSSGPGGQNVNKVNTKAEVRLNVEEAVWLPDYIKEKLSEEAKSHINKHGVLIVTADNSRSQHKNLQDALARIRQMIEKASYIPEGPSQEKIQRVLTYIQNAKERRLIQKRHHSEKKRDRGPVE